LLKEPRLLSIFGGRKKYGLLVLAVWLILTGLVALIHLDFLLFDKILAGLAIAAGVLIVLDR
jgi:hypothetical protein